MAGEEYFGSPDKVALMKRAAALRTLVADDPRFGYYGRIVGVDYPVDNVADVVCSLARLQGVGVAYYFPKDQVPALFAEFEARGFATDRHEHYRGGEAAYRTSLEVLKRHRLPADLEIVRLDADTPAALVSDMVALWQSCGVMPVPNSAMRGQSQSGITLCAVDGDGKPVANVCSLRMHHPASRNADDVFWGMLATRPDRRGERISLVLGAMAIVHMWENESARGFMTGVRQDNPSSQALCNRLGIEDTAWVYAQCIDAELLGTTSMTK